MVINEFLIGPSGRAQSLVIKHKNLRHLSIDEIVFRPNVIAAHNMSRDCQPCIGCDFFIENEIGCEPTLECAIEDDDVGFQPSCFANDD